MSAPPQHRGAFSLVEMILTIAVIGILATIAVPTIGDVLTGSKRSVAESVVETLNRATRKFGHSQWDLRTGPAPASGDDELRILRTLQWREPAGAGTLNPKGPFMRPDWNPSPSADEGHYRAQWTGTLWKLLPPGETGAGLQIHFDGSDLGTPYHHPADFAPVGAP